MAEKKQTRREVLETWAKELNVDKYDLEEMVLEWQEAIEVPICLLCGDPLDGSEPETVSEDGSGVHLECATQEED